MKSSKSYMIGIITFNVVRNTCQKSHAGDKIPQTKHFNFLFKVVAIIYTCVFKKYLLPDGCFKYYKTLLGT